jgi:hypothetical protein
MRRVDPHRPFLPSHDSLPKEPGKIKALINLAREYIAAAESFHREICSMVTGVVVLLKVMLDIPEIESELLKVQPALRNEAPGIAPQQGTFPHEVLAANLSKQFVEPKDDLLAYLDLKAFRASRQFAEGIRRAGLRTFREFEEFAWAIQRAAQQSHRPANGVEANVGNAFNFRLNVLQIREGIKKVPACVRAWRNLEIGLARSLIARLQLRLQLSPDTRPDPWAEFSPLQIRLPRAQRRPGRHQVEGQAGRRGQGQAGGGAGAGGRGGGRAGTRRRRVPPEEESSQTYRGNNPHCAHTFFLETIPVGERDLSMVSGGATRPRGRRCAVHSTRPPPGGLRTWARDRGPRPSPRPSTPPRPLEAR